MSPPATENRYLRPVRLRGRYERRHQPVRQWNVWTQAPGSQWTSLGNQTWILPADLTGFGCGVENATTCEPIGHFVSPDAWVPAAIGNWDILEANGSISDVIETFNVNGQAQLLFYSDPTIPEPASLALLGTALAGFGVIRRRRKAA